MKCKLYFIFFLFVSVSAFAVDTHSVSLGIDAPFLYEIKNYEDQISNADSYGIGLSVTCYSFWNDWRLGLMYSGSIDYPLKTDTFDTDIKADETDLNLMFNLLFGIALRTDPESRFQLVAGLGVHLMNYSGTVKNENRNISLSIFNAGVGADIAGKINLSDRFFLLTGSSLSYDFYNAGTVFSNYSVQYSAYDSYSGILIKPRVEFGFQYYKD